MSHNVAFARFFLEKACQVTVLPQMRISVEVEPESWADLLIHVRRSVCVVEFKLGAPLQPHQNPSEEAFWKEGSGYGAKFQLAYPRLKKRFVVLGHPRLLFFPKRPTWDFIQAPWISVARGFEERFGTTKLLCDLKDCLAQFEIWEFASMRARELSIYPESVVNGASAWEVLRQAYLSPTLQFSKRTSAYHLDAEIGERTGWHFGLEVQSGASTTLQALIRPRVSGPLMWFGYESERRGKAYRSVWLYCESEKIADFVEKELRPSRGSSYRLVRKDDDRGKPLYICIRTEALYGRRDFDWFSGWLRTCYGLAARFAPVKTASNPRSRSVERLKKTGPRRSFLRQLRA